LAEQERTTESVIQLAEAIANRTRKAAASTSPPKESDSGLGKAMDQAGEASNPQISPSLMTAIPVEEMTAIEADRERLLQLITQIPDGRRLATELIRARGQHFAALTDVERAAVIADLVKIVPCDA
jgi:hypothetical protein